MKRLHKRIEQIYKLREYLYSNYKNNNDKNNWNMDTMDFLIYFEHRLESLSYNRMYDNKLNDLVMSLIGFIKFSGFETNTEIKS